MIPFRLLLVPALSLLLLRQEPAVAAEGRFGADIPGAQDHPLVRRFPGSWLIGYKHGDWAEATLPVGNKVERGAMAETVRLEGAVTRIVYLAPQGRSALEVQRTYEQTLGAAGFKHRFACEKECADLYFAFGAEAGNSPGSFRWAEGSIARADGPGRYELFSAPSPFSGRFLYGTIARGGADVHVLVYSSVAARANTDIIQTTLVIVEPRPLPGEPLAVDAKTLQSGLQNEGKVALHGVFFDMGKAELKPDSKAQLDEMAKLLQAQSALKVYIVGHTDNQGPLDVNLSLSQQRAHAVAAALSANYKIDARRLAAKGLASLAPIASNGSEEGRARNRRVELVAQ